MKLSIVTPWHGGVGSLLAEYAAACEGAEIVTVDNASPQEDAQALWDYTANRGCLIRNETNAGFAAANNQGYRAATGDVIVFLNSDIAGDPLWMQHVLENVRDGALYSPSAGQQMIGGMAIPYLEGWCLAATRATWERLMLGSETKTQRGKRPTAPAPASYGPWDERAYPDPYWEDNDLCLRALRAGITLIQTDWPIRHKGGQTAGALIRHGAAFERNRATFAASALPYVAHAAQIAPTPALSAYFHHCANPSDIQHHLPLLFSLAKGDVLELGTRSGVSTAALLAGVEQRGGHVYSVDLDPRSAGVAVGHPQWTFRQGNSRSGELFETFGNMTFRTLLIDTLHTEPHVYDELNLWHSRMEPGGTICVHDTETFPGVRVAVERFCREEGWAVTFVRPGNGMAVIEVPQ